MSYYNENSTPRPKQSVPVNPEIAATDARLRDFIDPKTAEVLIADFDGDGGDLWHDALDNLQLKRIWPKEQPTFGLDESALKKLEAMPFKGKKSIVAHNGMGSGLIMRLEDALGTLTAQAGAVWHRVQLPEHFEMETGKLIERNAVGFGCDLWRDDLGNIQVRARAKTKDGKFTANIGTDAIARLRQLPCSGARSILLQGAHKDLDWIFPITGPHNLGIDFGSGYPVRRSRRLH